MSSYVTTVFTPDPTCVATDNLWLKTRPCRAISQSYGSETTYCTFVQNGLEIARETPGLGRYISQPCFPFGEDVKETIYTACPESYTEAYVTRSRDFMGNVNAITRCCPEGYKFQYGTNAYPSISDGQEYSWTMTDQPGCTATSVEVLYTKIITVTLATEPEVETTTMEFAETDRLFAEGWDIFGPTVYTDPSGETTSSCWGNRCPYSWEPEPTFPETIPTPVTTTWAAPTECLDPENLWQVTTSCYLPDNNYDITPDWLTCAITNFGAPEWYDKSCYPGYDVSTTMSEDTTLWYAGCPSGYTIVSSTSYPFSDTYRYPLGHFDITSYNNMCCPTAYSLTNGDVRQTETIHDGVSYSLFVYPPPGCYATSVEALSGKELVLKRYSNTMGWDKRDEDGSLTTITWDYEKNTLFARAQQQSYTVYNGTHTCYSQWPDCSSWLSYYYPDGIGGPTPSPTPTSGPSATTGSGSGSRETGSQAGQGSGSGAEQTAPAPTGAGSRTRGSASNLVALISAFAVLMIGNLL